MDKNTDNNKETAKQPNKFSKAVKCVKNGFSAFQTWLCDNKKSLIVLAISSVILNICLESALRKSVIKGFVLIFTSPVTFFFNALIIFSFYSIMYLFKRRMFVYTLITLLFAIVTTVSTVMMSFRTTPFNYSDFRMVKQGLDIIPNYINIWLLIPLVIIIVCLLALCFITAFVKSKKTTQSLLKSAIITGVTLTVMSGSALCYGHFKIGNQKFTNLPTEFKNHGFMACFILSIFDIGIDEPDHYSEEAVYKELDTQDKSVTVSNPTQDPIPPEKDMPNLVFLQLESYFDVNNVEGYTYNQNPIPVITSLKENNPNGLFRVPALGANTANTEFEVLTGMDLSYFGIAEYPYYTVLQEQTCESLPFNTKLHGYTAHAIHNYSGTFYDRHIVFSNLGFDNFASIENISNIQRVGPWAKDSLLTNQIKLALESTPDAPDFVYSISVQTHGSYPSTWDEYHNRMQDVVPDIAFMGNPNNPDNPGYAYYLNQLHQTDTYVGSVINEINTLGEPTVLVLFGDHLPAFDVEKWTLTKGNYYTTDYVICTFNCDYDFSDAPETLTSYQLGSYVLNKIGITEGPMNKLHHKYFGTSPDNEEYSNARNMLQYDMLFGKKFALKILDLDYEKTDIHYGLEKIYVTGLTVIGENTYVKGECFNEYSRITVNGDPCDTEFVNSTTLITNYIPKVGDIIGVIQEAQVQTTDHLGQSITSIEVTEKMLPKAQE